jgi:hypothetical protein
MKILTAGIYIIFRGLKFESDAEIGSISHFWMGTDYNPAASVPRTETLRITTINMHSKK